MLYKCIHEAKKVSTNKLILKFNCHISYETYPKFTLIQTKKSSDTQPATRAPRVASGQNREWPDSSRGSLWFVANNNFNNFNLEKI